jgi:hypothetical protein
MITAKKTVEVVEKKGRGVYAVADNYYKLATAEGQKRLYFETDLKPIITQKIFPLYLYIQNDFSVLFQRGTLRTTPVSAQL